MSRPDRPLAGLRILVTRERAAAEALALRLRALGATPVLLPALRIAPPDDPQALDAALRRIGDYDWVLFGSANAAAAVLDRLAALGSAAARPGLNRARVAAVGPQTRAVLAAAGVRVDRVPADFSAKAMSEALGDVAGLRVLLPRSEIAPPDLPDALEAAGASVDAVAAYRTLPAEPAPAELAEAARGLDVATFASGSAVRHVLAWVGGVLPADVLDGVLIASIGPSTTEAAAALGLKVAIEAREHTAQGLVDAIVAHVAGAAR